MHPGGNSSPFLTKLEGGSRVSSQLANASDSSSSPEQSFSGFSFLANGNIKLPGTKNASGSGCFFLMQWGSLHGLGPGSGRWLQGRSRPPQMIGIMIGWRTGCFVVVIVFNGATWVTGFLVLVVGFLVGCVASFTVVGLVFGF